MFRSSLLVLIAASTVFGQDRTEQRMRLSRAEPDTVGMRADHLQRIDTIVAEGLRPVSYTHLTLPTKA